MQPIELQKIGLTDGEAKVYLALTEIGSSTVGPIVKKANVAYSNVYDILNRLIEKGIVSFILRNKTKYFQAASPRNLMDWGKITQFCPALEYLGAYDYETKPADLDRLALSLLSGPVIAQIDFDAQGAVNPHFVVVVQATEDGTDALIADPWTGGLLRLGDSPYYNPAWGKTGLDRVARTLTGYRLLLPK